MKDVTHIVLTPSVKLFVTISVMLATIMQVLDTTIANVALSHIQGSISATSDQVSWILTSYIVASAITLPTSSWLSATYGRKNIFLISIFGFTVSSVLCGISTTLQEIILFRIIQGIFGAALIPLSQTILFDINPKSQHASAMAIWGIGIMLGPILGPTLGGYLTEYYNWRWVFYINVPVGIMAFFGTLLFVPVTKVGKKPFDKFGFITFSVLIASLQLMLDRGEQEDWFSSIEINIYLINILCCIWMFVVHIRSHNNPFITPTLFKDRNFTTCLILMFVVGIILLATMSLLPPFLGNVMGYSIIKIGLLLAPRGLGTMFAMIIVSRIANKVDLKYLVLLGLILTAYSLNIMSGFTTFVSSRIIIISGVIQGFGLGFIFVPLSTLAFTTISPNFRAEATTLFNLSRNIGSSVGVSITFALLNRSTQTNHSYLSENITAVNHNWEHYFSFFDRINKMIKYSIINGKITQEALTIGFLNDFATMMWLTITIIPFVFLLQKSSSSKKDVVIGD